MNKVEKILCTETREMYLNLTDNICVYDALRAMENIAAEAYYKGIADETKNITETPEQEIKKWLEESQ